MADEELRREFLLWHRPIPWDPAPWWFKLDKEQLARFNEVQVLLNTKIAALEDQKAKELAKIAGISLK
jgi:hypothetical protein